MDYKMTNRYDLKKKKKHLKSISLIPWLCLWWNTVLHCIP